MASATTDVDMKSESQTGSVSHDRDMAQILSESRSVKVILYGSTPVESEHRFWIDPEVTFGGVAKALSGMYPSQELVVLQANWGPRPYWTESHPDSPIGSTCRVLYAILKDQAKPYTMAVVRTSLSDYPIPIYVPASKSSMTLLEAVIASYPKLTGQVKSIALHPGDHDLRDDPWDNEFPQGQPYPTDPMFITTLDEPSKEFLAGSLYEAFSPLSPKASTSSDSDGLIPPLLQISFAECKLLVQRAYDLDAFPLQMIHLSEAIFHVVISLARSLTPVFENASSSIGDALSAEDDLADHLRVAPLLCRQLEELLDAVNGIMDNLESGSFDGEGAQHAIEKVFATLCGDLPGAVTVRCSENDFKKFGSIDCQELDTLKIDTHTKGVKTAYPEVIMEDKWVADLDPMMDLDSYSDASTLEYPDSVLENPTTASGAKTRQVQRRPRIQALTVQHTEQNDREIRKLEPHLRSLILFHISNTEALQVLALQRILEYRHQDPPIHICRVERKNADLRSTILVVICLLCTPGREAPSPFKEPNALAKFGHHFRSVHCNIRNPFVCIIPPCNKSFSLRHDMARHVKIAHADFDGAAGDIEDDIPDSVVTSNAAGPSSTRHNFEGFSPMVPRNNTYWHPGQQQQLQHPTSDHYLNPPISTHSRHFGANVPEVGSPTIGLLHSAPSLSPHSLSPHRGHPPNPSPELGGPDIADGGYSSLSAAMPPDRGPFSPTSSPLGLTRPLTGQ